MKQQPFKFELQSVLRVRKRETNLAQEVVEAAASRIADQRHVIRVIEQQLQRELNDVRDCSGPGNLLSLRRNSVRQGQLRLRIQNEQRSLNGLINEHKRARVALIECKMKEETIVQLRDNAYEQYLKDQEQADIAYTDELVQLTSARIARENL